MDCVNVQLKMLMGVSCTHLATRLTCFTTCFIPDCLTIFQVNRVSPSAGGGDVEKGHGGSSGSIAGGVVSSSPSVDSVGLANFGRSPPEVGPCRHHTATAVSYNTLVLLPQFP